MFQFLTRDFQWDRDILTFTFCESYFTKNVKLSFWLFLGLLDLFLNDRAQNNSHGCFARDDRIP